MTLPLPTARDSAAWRGSMTAAGGLLVLLGGVALCAWAGGALEYVQVVSTLPPIHYNSALGFAVWGAAYLALGRGRHRAARRAALALVALGAVLTAGQIPSLGLGLDRWAFAPPPSCPPFPPGGASPGLSIGLCLAGAAILLAARPEASGGRTVLVCLVGVVLTVGSPAALIFAESGSSPAGPPRVSVVGAVGAVAGGLGLLASAFRRGAPAAFGHALPLSVGLAGVALTIGLWAGLRADQNGRIHRQVQFEAGQVHRALQDRLRQEYEAVTGLSDLWSRDPEQIKEAAAWYFAPRTGCLGLGRVDGRADDALKVTWVEVPQTLQAPPLPTTLEDLGVAGPVAEALRERRPVATRAPRSLWQGTRVLAIFVPDGAGRGGGLLSVQRVPDMMTVAVAPNLAPGYAVVVSEQDDPLFARFATELEYKDHWSQVLPVNFHGFGWRLTVWPTGDVMGREVLSLPALALAIGLLTTALLALAVHLAQTSRRRTADLEKEVRERAQTQRALEQSEEKYRTLIENLGQGISLRDRDYRYVAANPQFCRNLGRAEAEILGRTDAELFDPREAADRAEEARTVLAEGTCVESEEDRTVGGRRTCTRRVLTPVRDAAGRVTGVLGITWDVTEQRQLEAHVHQASKMDAIGQLAGGIAHDFNNLLTAILGNLELLLTGLPADDPAAELAASARDAATRAASLTQRLLGFSRRHHLDWVACDVSAVVGEVVGLLRRTIDPLIRIETRAAAGPWAVLADPARINQVLMNLCLNARDAIGGAGQITVETALVPAAELPKAGGLGNRAGEFVRLRVSDTGCGMTDEVRARMFEPFFTTKEVGKGTGLGLPMVFAIVREHKGWIDCWSEPGKGTRFDVYLPRGEAARPPAPAPAAPAPARDARGRILVVDDEEVIRRVAVLTLRGRGYTVLEAADGQEAVDVYSRDGDRIDLVLLDLTMPVLSGHEAFRHLLRLNSRVKVLFASGYAVEQLTDLEKELMAGFVNKPYRPTDLLTAVEEALQRRGDGGPGLVAETPLDVRVPNVPSLLLPAG